jgi:hypothetical protein
MTFGFRKAHITSRPKTANIFISKGAGPKYSSGAYIDYVGGEKLMLFHFDSRFTGQEGKLWRYEE